MGTCRNLESSLERTIASTTTPSFCALGSIGGGEGVSIAVNICKSYQKNEQFYCQMHLNIEFITEL